MIYKLDVVNSMIIYADLIAARDNFHQEKGLAERIEAGKDFLFKKLRMESEVSGKLGYEITAHLKSTDEKRYNSILQTEEEVRQLLSENSSD